MTKREVVRYESGYTLKHIGDGRWRAYSPDGQYIGSGDLKSMRKWALEHLAAGRKKATS
jgi:hypothetical protein